MPINPCTLKAMRAKRLPRICFILLLAFSLLLPLTTKALTDPIITEYISPNAQPSGITTGPDGALWFTGQISSSIGRMTTSGVANNYAIPRSGDKSPLGITTGPDGALWFTESATIAGNRIGRITTSGAITEYLVSGNPTTITTGPDGALWFTEGLGKIGRLTVSGVFNEYVIPTPDNSPNVITTGPDGALWFTSAKLSDGVFINNRITRLSIAGQFTEYNISTFNARPYGITSGPDGALWFTEWGSSKIGRITTTGSISEYHVPTVSAQPFFITSGPDGAMWFTERTGNKIGRITTEGVISEYILPYANSLPYGITSGPDGAMWFTEIGTNHYRVAKITAPGPLAPEAPLALNSISPAQAPQLSWDMVEGAESYNVFRNGVNSGSVPTNSFTDNAAPEGNNTYYVTAVNAGGESPPSNNVNVVVDRTLPDITYSMTSPPNAAGWNNTNVTVTFSCSDSSAGIETCSNPVTLNAEGANQSANGSAVDKAGNTRSITADNINIDKTVPSTSNLSLDDTTILYSIQDPVSIMADADDTLSGVTTGEYYIDTDPGQGQGSSLAFANGQLAGSADLDNLSVGQHTLYVRAKDVAGNWSDTSSIQFTVNYPAPAAPTGLTATTPTKQKPGLSWMATFDPSTPPASAYHIYRNGSQIGTTTTTSFTDDELATDGIYTYFVRAVNQFGVESDDSNTVTITYDITSPTVTHSASSAPNTAGWYKTNVTINFTCSDSLSGIDTCSPPVTLSGDGGNQSVAGTAVDKAGNSSSVTVSGFNIDKTAPTASNVTMSSGTVLSFRPVTIMANASDGLSGVARGEYYIDADPGQGQGVSMTYANGQLTTTATITGLNLGTHTLYVRSIDKAGNWSSVASVTFFFVF